MGPESDQRFSLLGVELIHDKDPGSLRIYRKGLFNVVLKVFLRTGLAQGWTEDLSSGYLKVSHQAPGTLPVVFEVLVFDPSGLHRKRRMGTFLGLDTRFFIRAHKVRTLFLERNGLLIQGADRLAAPIKGVLIHLRGAFPIAHSMGL